jgi:hypothetical protein
VPVAGDVVSIGANVDVTYDVVSDAAVKTVAVQAGGSLRFRTDVSTRLTVVNLLVMEGGLLQIGTLGNPVAAGVKAEVVFADVPLDLANDPAQYGNGLIALGKVSMYGAAMSQTFVNLAAEPHAGDTTLTLSAPVTGWRPGDRLILADTRQLSVDDLQYTTSQRELVTLAGVSADGLTLTLSAPLLYDHLGARDATGTLVYLPDIADLTRNVVIHSANARGTRGHTLFTAHADVDIHYAQFSGLGRTKIDPLDNTTFNADGSVAHVGTNETGRYAVNFRDLIGPAGGQADGYQYTFQGNSVFCPLDPMPFRWGIDIHDSHYGLIQDNVLYNWAGAGLIADVGNETGNVIAHNLVTHITGTFGRPDDRGSGQDVGFEGYAYWFRSTTNVVRGNVASESSGYMYYPRFQWDAHVPVGPGADTSVAGQYRDVDMTDVPITEFSNNTSYGGRQGALQLWSVGSYGAAPHADAGESLVKNFTAWNVSGYVYYNYETGHVTFDGYTFIGDANALRRNQSVVGIYGGDYVMYNFLLKNGNIQNAKSGIYPSLQSGGGTQTFQDTYFRNYFNVTIAHIGRYTADALQGSPDPRTIIFRNDRFALTDSIELWDPNGPKSNFLMLNGASNNSTNFLQKDQTFVYAYNGNPNDNFRLYFNDQAATALAPVQVLNPDGTVNESGVTVAGLTNKQAWSQFGVAMCGEVAPADATQRDLIVGLTEAI